MNLFDLSSVIDWLIVWCERYTNNISIITWLFNNVQHCRVCLQRTWILTEAGSDVPTLFMPRHCRVLLLLTDTLLIVKLVSLTRLYILSQNWPLVSQNDFRIRLQHSALYRQLFSKTNIQQIGWLNCYLWFIWLVYTNELSSKQMSCPKPFQRT